MSSGVSVVCRADTLDEMPVFVGEADGDMLPGEDTASQNVLLDKMFGSKKFVDLYVYWFYSV